MKIEQSGVYKRAFDLHTHAIPAVDDGATSSEESVGMLKRALECGVGTVALTSHCSIHRDDGIERFLNMRKPSLDRLLFRMKERGFAMPLLVGAEIYADHDISSHALLDSLCYTAVPGTGAEEPTNKCLLYELPPISDRDVAVRSISKLNSRGYKVLMAHVERYRDCDEIMSALSGLDIYYQINADSLLSFGGKSMFDKMLRRSGRIVLSSDMHNLTKRPCRIDRALALVEKKFGSDIAEAVFVGNARAFLGIK